MRVIVFAALLASFALGGCASIVSGQNQSVSVVAKGESTDVAGAKCSLTNDKGQWFATTPGSVTVRRSYSALAVDCKTETAAGTAQVKSATKPMAFGNIIFGGIIGVGVDVATGAAYDYPDVVSIPLVELVGPRAGTPPAAPVAVIATAMVEPAAPAAIVPPAESLTVRKPELPVEPPRAIPAVSPPPEPIKPAAAVVVAQAGGGKDSFQARRLAQSMQCSADPAPVFIAKNPGSETYSVPCANGESLVVKCEFGNCRVLR